jgi:organic radical activating enzyme
MVQIAKIDNCAMAEFDDSITAVIFFCGCDLACTYCQNRGISVFNGHGCMERDAMEVLQVIKWDAVDWVSFSGGEVLHSVTSTGSQHHLPIMLAYAKEKGKKTNLDTNAYFPGWVDTEGVDLNLNYTKLGLLYAVEQWIDCVSVDIKMQLMKAKDYKYFTIPLSRAGVLHKCRFRLVILEGYVCDYTSEESIDFLLNNGISRLRLMPNSFEGGGANFPRTKDETMQKVRSAYEKHGIEVVP